MHAGSTVGGIDAGAFVSQTPDRTAAVKASSLPGVPMPQQPALQTIYDMAPIGLAFLSPDCRYLQINQRLTEICGISVEDHLGRSVRDCVPALADAVEEIVSSKPRDRRPRSYAWRIPSRSCRLGTCPTCRA